MAWYYRTYACGHEGRVNVKGKTEERMQRLDEILPDYARNAGKNRKTRNMRKQMQKQRKKQQKTISPS